MAMKGSKVALALPFTLRNLHFTSNLTMSGNRISIAKIGVCNTEKMMAIYFFNLV